MKIVTAPEVIPFNEFTGPSMVFLAGSIEMGTAEDWQKQLIKQLSEKYLDKHLTLLNPRRENFDPSEEKSADNVYFSTQVDWELEGLSVSDYTFMYFDPNTKSPITLLELGLQADSICQLIVVCPDGFYRQGNVEIVCKAYGISYTTSLDEGVRMLCEIIDYDNNLDEHRD